MIFLDQWRRIQSYLAGVPTLFITSTEHALVYLSRVGVFTLLLTQHSDIQALEDFGEVVCQTRASRGVESERQHSWAWWGMPATKP